MPLPYNYSLPYCTRISREGHSKWGGSGHVRVPRLLELKLNKCPCWYNFIHRSLPTLSLCSTTTLRYRTRRKSTNSAPTSVYDLSRQSTTFAIPTPRDFASTIDRTDLISSHIKMAAAGSVVPALADRPIKNTIVLFDVDGTLTPARLVSLLPYQPRAAAAIQESS
jgi:hypothetical protein